MWSHLSPRQYSSKMEYQTEHQIGYFGVPTVTAQSQCCVPKVWHIWSHLQVEFWGDAVLSTDATGDKALLLLVVGNLTAMPAAQRAREPICALEMGLVHKFGTPGNSEITNFAEYRACRGTHLRNPESYHLLCELVRHLRQPSERWDVSCLGTSTPTTWTSCWSSWQSEVKIKMRSNQLSKRAVGHSSNDKLAVTHLIPLDCSQAQVQVPDISTNFCISRVQDTQHEVLAFLSVRTCKRTSLAQRQMQWRKPKRGRRAARTEPCVMCHPIQHLVTSVDITTHNTHVHISSHIYVYVYTMHPNIFVYTIIAHVRLQSILIGPTSLDALLRELLVINGHLTCHIISSSHVESSTLGMLYIWVDDP